MNYTPFYDSLQNTQLEPWIDAVRPRITTVMHPDYHGKMGEWTAALNALPPITPTQIDLLNAVRIDADIDEATRQHVATQLMKLHPWRKGGFHIYGTHIDTEWRSDWKWDRIKDHVDLVGKRVLDVGCGNGYYGWRMMGAGAKQVIGIDPYLIYVMQFWAIEKIINLGSLPLIPPKGEETLIPLPSGGVREGRFNNHSVLPVGIEHVPHDLRAFDVAFSMGVLYHRRSPFDHLFALREMVRPHGQIILETLVIDGKLGDVLVPQGRYAKMRNVWFIPSVLTLESWLKKCQFHDITLLDVTPTTVQEQRSTEWMTFHSLPDFLSDDGERTAEGHPPPIRATFKMTVR